MGFCGVSLALLAGAKSAMELAQRPKFNPYVTAGREHASTAGDLLEPNHELSASHKSMAGGQGSNSGSCEAEVDERPVWRPAGRVLILLTKISL
jgi:hypothetical protein